MPARQRGLRAAGASTDVVAAAGGGELHAYRAATLFSGTFNRSAHIRGLGGSELPPDTFDANVVSAIPSAIKRAAVLLTLFCMAAGVVFFAWSVYHRRSRLLKVSQPGFLCAIIVGSLLSLSAVLPASRDHLYTDPTVATAADGDGTSFPDLDVACNMQVWQYSLGFMTTFGSLLTKLWRITRVVNSTSIGLKGLSNARLVATVLVFVVTQAAVLLVLTLIAPLRYHVIVERRHGFVVNSFGRCETSQGIGLPLLMATGAMHLGLLVYANIICYQARNIPTQYAETKYIAFACANHMQTKAFAVVAAAFTYNEPGVTFLVKWLALTVSDMGTLCLIFVPKMWMLYSDGSVVLNEANDRLRDAAIAKWNKKTGTRGERASITASSHGTAYVAGDGSSTVDGRSVAGTTCRGTVGGNRDEMVTSSDRNSEWPVDDEHVPNTTPPASAGPGKVVRDPSSKLLPSLTEKSDGATSMARRGSSRPSTAYADLDDEHMVDIELPEESSHRMESGQR